MTNRVGVNALDPNGGSPGQVPTINAAGTALEYATPGTVGGGGTAAQSYIGTNSVGGTMTLLVTRRVYMKKVTLASPGLLTNIEAYIDGAGASGQVDSLNAAVMADSSGAPGSLLGASMLRDTSALFDATSGTSADGPPRWFGLPIGRWLAAGSYWLAVSVFTDASIGTRIANTTGGTDRYYDSGGSWFSDGGFYTITTTTANYSIRGNLITL